MKTISLWEPWASLIALGLKTVETRSWETTYRGLLAIHAAKKWNSELDELTHTWPFAELLVPDWTPQLGHIVAIAELVACKRMTTEGIRIRSERASISEEMALADQVALDYLLGLWEPGRYAWVLAKVRPLLKPIPVRGAQGIWNWDATEGLQLGPPWDDGQATAVPGDPVQDEIALR